MDSFITGLVRQWCGRQDASVWDRWDVYGFARIVKTAIGHGLAADETAALFRETLRDLRREREWSDGEFAEIAAQIDSAIRLFYVFASAFPYSEDSDDDPFPYPH